MGPEIEENLSLRYLASALARHGHTADLVPFNQDPDFGPAVEAIVEADPLVVFVAYGRYAIRPLT